MGFFGPIGVGAIFYLSVSQEYLRTNVLDDNGMERPDAARLRETMTVVIWFLVVCSIVSLPPYYVIHCCCLSGLIRLDRAWLNDRSGQARDPSTTNARDQKLS